MVRIIDYKAGNAPSVLHAVRHLGFRADYARGAKDFGDATHIILPGVGTAEATMDSLKAMNMLAKLEKIIIKKKVPFLGICVGMQVLFEHSEEGDALGLGWLKGNIVKYDTQNVRVPQMGWNQVRFVKDTPLTPMGVRLMPPAPEHFYFVNSYHVKPANESDIWALSDYNGDFVAGIQHENIYATQFHIEKSGEAGLRLLRRFLELEREI
ncbi:MAG: imidazole glycerol phosphate synthase subunit HisH [Defluviitaleaceae bacterium]|nr:imidazole glycerol phosphate synthase subunit HisH [Defluviitaleaceae bacterium]